MKLSYIIWLGLKNLGRRKLRTLLTAGAVTIGVGAVVFLMSLGIGLQKLIVDQVASLDSLSNLTVTPSSKLVKLNDESVAAIKGFGDIQKEEAVISVPMKASRGDSQTEGVVFGVDPTYASITSMPLLAGKSFGAGDMQGLIVNQVALKLLGLAQDQSSLGKEIKIEYVLNKDLVTNPNADLTPTATMKVVGISDTEKTPVVYAPFDLLTSYGITTYSSLIVRMNDARNATRVAELRKKIENAGFKTDYIGDTVDQINQIFTTFKIVLAGFGAIALFISILGMFNTLTVTLLEKTREVGFMKAIGVQERDVKRIFLVEAMLITLIGGMVGMIVSYILGKSLNFAVNLYAQRSGSTPISFFTTPLYLVGAVIALILVIGFSTGYMPARRAAKIDPLDALRYE